MSKDDFLAALKAKLEDAKVHLGRRSKDRTAFIEDVVANVRAFLTPAAEVRVVQHDVQRTPSVQQSDGVTQMSRGGSQMADEANGNLVR